CPDGDVEDFDGMTLEEADSIDGSCGEAIDHQMLLNYRLDLGVVAPAEGGGAAVGVEVSFLAALQTGSGKPCDLNHSGSTYTFSDRCEQVSKSTRRVTVGDQWGSEEDYLKVGFKGIKMEDSGQPRWYSAGALEVIYNNWSGTMTFTGPN